MSERNEDQARSVERAPILSDDFSTFVWPLEAEEFRTSIWEKKPFVSVAGQHRLSAILKDINCESVPEILQYVRGPVIVWAQDGHGDLETQRVDKELVNDSYKSGMAIYFELDKAIEQARKWVAPVEVALGLPSKFSFSNLIVVGGPFVTPLHFDPNENFTIQLKGKKRWRVWKNKEVLFPLHNYVARRPLHKELKLYVTATNFSDLGKPDLDVQLEPGAVLYVPRGAWHTVEASGPSIQFNIAIPPFTWIDVFMPLIRQRLTELPVWRKNAYSMLHEGRMNQKHPVEFSAMMRQLCADLDGILLADHGSVMPPD